MLNFLSAAPQLQITSSKPPRSKRVHTDDGIYYTCQRTQGCFANFVSAEPLKRSSEIQWPSFIALLDIRFRRTLHHHLRWNKEEGGKCKFQDRTPNRLAFGNMLVRQGWNETRARVGLDNLSLGYPEQELRFPTKDRRSSLSLLPGCFRKRGEKERATKLSH